MARAGSGPVDAEIVGAAAHLFATHGIGATTMAQIAEAVGLEVSSIYYYFASKHEVLERIVVDVNRVPLAIAAEVQVEFADAARRLHAFVRRDAAALCDFPFDFNEIHRLRPRRSRQLRALLGRPRAAARRGRRDRSSGNRRWRVPPGRCGARGADDPGQRRGGAELVPTVDRSRPRLGSVRRQIGAFVADLALRGAARRRRLLASVTLDTVPDT